MLEQIEFKQDHRCFKTGETFDFRRGVNLIVGDQGTGKTTIMKAFTDKLTDIISVKGSPCSWYHFDFEKDNPRKRGYIKTGFDVASRFSSHGESNLAILNMLTISKDLNKNPSIILADEADMALSIRSCYKLVSLFKELVNKGHQVVAVVHNVIVIESFEEVLSMEHKRWMSSKEFIESQKTPLDEKDIQ